LGSGMSYSKTHMDLQCAFERDSTIRQYDQSIYLLTYMLATLHEP